MSGERVKAIKLEFEPNPEGDNSFELRIGEGQTKLTYYASKFEKEILVEAGNVNIIFNNCITSRYFASEPKDNIYPGWFESDSDLCEIEKSKWVASLNEYHGKYHHYMFCLNHQVFECIAESINVIKPSSE